MVEIEGVEYVYVKPEHENCFECAFEFNQKLCNSVKCGKFILKEVVKNGEGLRRDI